ncbi:hypothetical protein SAMN05216386_0202 [Nitrosospira briensis]|uniref:Uncharacterized protein n=1 Tax=Nitrosospira briensis TaxID=35799 RepID=A0A1I4XLY1_9PROT|nr:hypothetical protein SAMN05216386_0202 [Nitrosospira briensis]
MRELIKLGDSTDIRQLVCEKLIQTIWWIPSLHHHGVNVHNDNEFSGARIYSPLPVTEALLHPLANVTRIVSPTSI